MKGRFNRAKDKNIKMLDASALKYECLQEKYHKALDKYKLHINYGSSIHEEYKEITWKMKKAANEVLRSSKAPLTPIRKQALNR